MTRPRGFTLIELLMVITIIAILAGMAMPILNMASRSAKRQSSLATMNKVETGLRLFKAEVGSYPYQPSYADINAGEIPGNELYRRIGATMDDETAVQDLLDDADTAASQYDFPLLYPGTSIYTHPKMVATSNDTGGDTPPAACYSRHAFRPIDVKPRATSFTGEGVSGWGYVSGTDTYSLQRLSGTKLIAVDSFSFDYMYDHCGLDKRLPPAIMLNRMGAERARLAIMAGNPWVKGCKIRPTISPNGGIFTEASYTMPMPTGVGATSDGICTTEVTRTLTPNHNGRDNSTAPLVSAPQSIGKPGWCADYLAGEIPMSAIDQESKAVLDAWHQPLVYICQVIEGPRKSHPGIILGATTGIIDVWAYGLGTAGRIVLNDKTPIDTDHLPDPTNPLHSDRRTHAKAGYENAFELWSAGNDCRFAWMRDEAVNSDNIPLNPYDAGIR